MKRKILTIALLFSFVFADLGLNTAKVSAADSDVQKIYVAVDGDDSGTGTLSNPLETMEKALERVNELKNRYPNSSFVIYFREGTYRITSRVILENKLNGDNILKFKAYNDEEVVFSGAKEIDITAVNKLSDNAVISKIRNYKDGNVYSVNLADVGIAAEDVGELFYFGEYSDSNPVIPAVDMNSEFYINNTRMIPARYPNSGYITGYRVLDEGGDDDNDGVKISYDFGFDASEKWTSPYKRVYAQFQYDWAGYSLDIQEIGSQKEGWFSTVKYIKTAQAAPFGATEDGRYYVYNLIEELDNTGEYYYDKDTNILYFYSENTPEKCEMTVADTMFRVKEQKNISFEGITFEKLIGGPVYATDSDNIDINNCILRYCSGGTVYMDNCTNSGMRNSVMYDVADGITITGGDADRKGKLESSDNYIINNEIYNFGFLDGTYQPAIRVSGVGDKVAHNKVYDSPHQALVLGGYNCIVEYNEFYNINSDTSDSGCIYAGQNFAKRGNIIRYNYFHDMPEGRQQFNAAVYLDDYFSGTTVYGNVFEDVERAVMINNGYDNSVENNVFIDSEMGIRLATAPTHTSDISYPDGSIYKKSVIYDTEEWRKEFPQLFESSITNNDELVWAHGNTIQNNYSVGSGEDSIGSDSTYSTLLQKNTIANTESVNLTQYAGETRKDKAFTLIGQKADKELEAVGVSDSLYERYFDDAFEDDYNDSGDDSDDNIDDGDDEDIIEEGFAECKAYDGNVRVWGKANIEKVVVMLVKKTAGNIPSQSDIAYFTEVKTDKDGKFDAVLSTEGIDVSDYEVRLSTGNKVEVKELGASASINDLISIDVTMLGSVTWASLVADIDNFYNIDVEALGLKVFGAIYDNSGKLIGARVCDLKNADINEQLQMPEGADYMKCFVWDGAQKPIKNIPAKNLGKDSFAINCWGDSLTYGSGGNGNSYPKYLSEIMGEATIIRNYGVGGETTRTIAGRQGGVPFILSTDIEIPADQTPVKLSILEGNPLAQSGNDGINPCYIDGVKGSLSMGEGNILEFTRATAGDVKKVNKGTVIVTDASDFTGADINIIFTGANDVGKLALSREATTAKILDYQKAMADKVKANGGKYLIVGVADGELASYIGEFKYLEKVQKANFGKNYLNLREALADTTVYEKEGIELTESDKADIASGVIPGSIICDDGVHFNENGYKIVARVIYNKLVSLGMVIGQNN